MQRDLLFECERPQAGNGVPRDWVPNYPAGFLLRSSSGPRPSVNPLMETQMARSYYESMSLRTRTDN